VIGEIISHYRIVQKLGGGGMGEVYEAEDVRLGRRVALKFIPAEVAGDPQALERFQREARATSSLNHPNISTIYDIASHNGLPFIVMELLEGESLKRRIERSPLPPEDIFDIGIQLGEALDAAHSRGIIHRDIKPGNIFLTNLGQAKVLDFGLAKLAEEPKPAVPAAGGPRHRTAEAITEVSAIPGTTLYMSPEQARGEEIDTRSDLFSLGSVMYEMASQRKPFLGRNAVLTLHAIQHQRPVSPSNWNPEIPPGLEQVIGRLMEKDVSLRYQNARELVTDLRKLKRQYELRATRDGGGRVELRPTRSFRKFTARQLYVILGVAGLLVTALLAITVWWAKHGRGGAARAGAKQTVVVLPFRNISGDPDLDYMRLALPDELVKILAYSNLEIRPVPTTPAYLQGNFDPQQAGRDLKAATVITGHFMEAGDRILITLDAVDVRGNRLLWQASLTVPSQNLISLQEELASQVRQGLLPALGSEAAMIATATQPRNADAYDLYLRGAALPHDAAPNGTAIVMLQHAVELDPNFAPAWDALGLRYYYDASYYGGGIAAFDKAAAAYERALKLDPNLISSVAHLTRIRAERGQVAAAIREAQDLVKRRPENAQAHFTLAYVLRYAGLLHDAAPECNAAVALDPGNYDFRSCSFVFFELGQTTKALEYLTLDSGSEWAASVLPSILLRDGKTNEARLAAAKVPAGSPWFGNLLRDCLKPAPAAVLKKEAEQAEPELMAQRDPEFRYYQGAILAWCGQEELAARLIQSAIAQNYCSYTALYDDPLLPKLRASPAFAGLTEAAQRCQAAVTPK
jgi:TolB-like protein